MEENKVECKSKKKGGVSVTLMILFAVIGFTFGYIITDIIEDNKNETKEEQKESNKIEESNSNVESNSNTTEQTKPEVKTYTTTELKGTYTFKSDNYTKTIKLFENGLFELEHTGPGGFIRVGNYVINNDTITFNNLVDGQGGAVVINKTINEKIISSTSFTYENETFTKTDDGKNNTPKYWLDILNDYAKCTEV